jgi:mRNA interferase MazF
MQRGDIVTVSAPGDYGKPRPAVVIQGDILNQANSRSSIVLLMTGTIVDAPLLRLTLRPTPDNGLKKISQVQANRILTLPTEKIGQHIGQLTEMEIIALNRLLAIVIGLS